MPRLESSPNTGPQESNKGERKRKRSQHSNQSLAAQTQQPTISQLFSTSQQKPITFSKHSPDDSLSLSSNKRARVTNSSAELSLPKVVPPDKMYNFTSPKSGVVDLTMSPSRSSPFASARRMSGVQRTPQFGTNSGPRRLIVKNLRTTSRSDPTEYFNKTWNQLDAALTAIFNNGQLQLSMEELYRGVENLCRQGKAPELSQRLFARCRAYVGGSLKQPILDKAGEKDVTVLKAVLVAWKTWNNQLITLRSIFFYMDRAYLLQTNNPSIYDTAVALFRNLVFGDSSLKHKTIDGACDVLELDRRRETLDQEIFRDAVRMFFDLSVYTSDFEPRMLGSSQTYIAYWTERASSEKSLPDYVRGAHKLIETEMHRCETFALDASTKRDLLTLLEDHLVQRKADYLVQQDAVAELLDDNAVETLEQLYSLLQRRRMGNKLRPAFDRWIVSTGSSIIFNEKDQDQMVVRLLSLKKQLDNIHRESFHKDEELGHALREDFEVFMNKSEKSKATWGTDNSKPGEMIAKYVDMLLRGGAKAIPAQLSKSATAPSIVAEEEDNEEAAMDEMSVINNQLDQVLDLFRFVHGKAVFEAFYKKDLARRLLMERSADADAERSMLTRLKTECGAGFTQNLEQMFKDIELAREEMGAYKAMLQEKQLGAKIDLSAKILSAAAWPTYPDVSVAVPNEIRRVIEDFEKYYQLKHTGRKLDWKHALAHCQLKANFPLGKKELVVSSFQAIVLLLFNGVAEGEHLTYEHLKAETGLPEADLNRILQSLACAKLRPLTKHPKGREINQTDTFTFNTSFKHEKYRIKINQIQLKETKEENKETHERVAADRNFETQAAIVRIMKSKKMIKHVELVAEVISATKSRGVLPVADIKKNIDRLIEKEYMEREDDGSYTYLA